MTTLLTQERLAALLANPDSDRERPGELYEALRRQLVRVFESRGCSGFVEDLADKAMFQIATQFEEGLDPTDNSYAYFRGVADRVVHEMLQRMDRALQEPATLPAEEPDPVSSAPALTQPTHRHAPLFEPLRHLLQTYFPALYAQALESTLADLRHEHSAALAAGHPMQARCALLRGCGALAAAAVCQLGFSLLRRITALWQARSSK